MRLTVTDLAAGFGERVLFSDLSFSVSSGESLAVMGPSGVGKSTLLSIIAGFAPQSAGSVNVDGEPGPRPAEYLVQSAPLLSRRSVMANVCMGRWISQGASENLESEALEILDRLGLHGRSDSPTFRLSGGERQRVAVARAILNRPALLLADEPTASLDGDSRDAVVDEIVELVGRGCIAIVATHDPAVAERCNRTVQLSAATIGHLR